MTAFAQSQRPRPGFATIWAILVLIIVSAVSAIVTAQFVTVRRQTDDYRNRLQAEWLARSGTELAIARLLADPNYAGETVTPIQRGEVKVTVKKDAAGKGTYLIESEGRYPAGERNAAVRTDHRAASRTDNPPAVRIVPPPAAP